MVRDFEEVCRELRENDWYISSFQMHQRERNSGTISDSDFGGWPKTVRNVPVTKKRFFGLSQRTEMVPAKREIIPSQIFSNAFGLDTSREIDARNFFYKQGNNVYLMLDKNGTNGRLSSYGFTHSDGAGRPNDAYFHSDGRYMTLQEALSYFRIDPRFLSQFSHNVFGWENKAWPYKFHTQPELFPNVKALNIMTPERGNERVEFGR